MRTALCLLATLFLFFFGLSPVARAWDDIPDLPADGMDCAAAAALPQAGRDALLRAPQWEGGLENAWEYGFYMRCVNLPYPLPPRFTTDGVPRHMVLHAKNAAFSQNESYPAHTGEMELELFLQKNGREISLGEAEGIIYPMVYAVKLFSETQTEFFILAGQGSIGNLFRVAAEDGRQLTGSDIFAGATQRGQRYFLDPELSQARREITIYRNESGNDKNAWVYARRGEKYRLLQTVDYKGYVAHPDLQLCISHTLDEEKGVWRRGVVDNVFDRNPVRMLILKEAPLFDAPPVAARSNPPYVVVGRQPELSPREGRNAREYSPAGKSHTGNFILPKGRFKYSGQDILPGVWVDVADMVEDEANRGNPHQRWLYVSYMKDGKRIAGWIDYKAVMVDSYDIDREPLAVPVPVGSSGENSYVYKPRLFYIGGRKTLNGEEWYEIKGGWNGIWVKKMELEAYLEE